MPVFISGKCPICLKGKVFKNFLEPYNYCPVCVTSFNINKIGDGASWATSFFLCVFSIPISFYLDNALDISYFELVFLMLVIILILSVTTLRLIRNILIVKLKRLEQDEKK